MFKLYQKPETLAEPYDDYQLYTHVLLPLGTWFKDIFCDLKPEYRLAWLDLLALAMDSSGAGQINYVSNDQVAGMLGMDVDIFENVVEIGRQRGKIEVVERTIVPAIALLKVGGSMPPEDHSRNTFLDARLYYANPCARYTSMIFPGAYEYFRENPIHHGKYEELKSRTDEISPELRWMIKEAYDLYRQRLESPPINIPSLDIFKKGPFCVCKPEELPESIIIYDEAFGELDYSSLQKMDNASCAWRQGSTLRLEEFVYFLMERKRSMLDRLGRFLGAGSIPGPDPLLRERLMCS